MGFQTMRRAVRASAMALLVGSLAFGPLGAQQREAPPQDTAAVDSATVQRVSPGGAFLRAVLIPGWGHAAVGAYTRGGFYFAAEAGTGWMLFKTLSFLAAAEESRNALEADVRARILAQGITDPDSIQAHLDDDQDLQDANSLVETRKAQREDWLALGVFMVLLGGADAFVSSHLADFPQPVELSTTVLPGSRKVEISVSVPWGGPGG